MPFESYKPSSEEIAKAESMMTEEQRAMSEQREKEWQEKNFENALNSVSERYPELADKIKNSLETPQLGQYHNEGPKMDSHISLILKNLESIKKGQFPETLQDQYIQDIMKELVIKQDKDDPEKSIINPALIDYAFFHDIAKPDCLNVKIEGEKKGIEISWEQWQKIVAQGTPYQLEGKSITAVSYFHQSEGAAGQHGNKAAEMLKDKGLSPEIIIAIGKHEVAYQFSKINAATYEEHFVRPGFSEEQQKFILVASYIDTMASLGPDGKPDLGNFANLVKSRNNYLLIKQYTDKSIPFRENELTALKKQDRILTAEDVEKIIPKEEKYNMQVFSEKLDSLLAEGQITAVEKEEIMSIVSSQPKELGKKFGPKMKFIKPLLEQSKE